MLFKMWIRIICNAIFVNVSTEKNKGVDKNFPTDNKYYSNFIAVFIIVPVCIAAVCEYITKEDFVRSTQNARVSVIWWLSFNFTACTS